MENDSIKIVEFIICIIFFLIGRYILPKTKDAIQNAMTQFQVLLSYAESFCAYAREFLKCSGSEKMDDVVKKLTVICEQQNIDVDEETLRAIGQKAYDSMIKGEIKAEVILQDYLEDVKQFPTTEIKSTEDKTSE